MARADRVTVLGGGVFGLACAYSCAVRGARVTVIEPRHIGAGSSGGTVGALAPHAPEDWDTKKQFQFESLLMAQAFWAGVAAYGGAPGYGRTGRLQSIHTPRQLALAQQRAETAVECWGDAASWRVAEVGEFAVAPQSDTGFVVHDTLTARAAPRAACAALAQAITALGGAIVPDAPLEGVVIHATGWDGLRDLSDLFGKLVGNGVKGQSALLRPVAGCALSPDAPQIYADGVHIVPHADGSVGIGSTSERYFDTPDTTDVQLEDLIARAIAACPVLAGAEVVDRWAGVRPRAITRAPILGEWPDRPGHFIVNGGFKIGFGMAPKIGQVMADLVLDGRNAIPEGFRVADCI